MASFWVGAYVPPGVAKTGARATGFSRGGCGAASTQPDPVQAPGEVALQVQARGDPGIRVAEVWPRGTSHRCPRCGADGQHLEDHPACPPEKQCVGTATSGGSAALPRRACTTSSGSARTAPNPYAWSVARGGGADCVGIRGVHWPVAVPLAGGSSAGPGSKATVTRRPSVASVRSDRRPPWTTATPAAASCCTTAGSA